MWHVWHATLSVWLFSTSSACGMVEWQCFAFHPVPVHRRDRVHLAEHLVLRRRCGSRRTPCPAPSAPMWTSTAREGSNTASSRSPCFTLFPPPPKKWQVPQFVRWACPTCCATSLRSTDGSGMPGAAGRLRVCPAVVMAGQAVHVQRILEIERGIRVSVPDVAPVAALLVAGHADAEVVQHVPSCRRPGFPCRPRTRSVPSSSASTASPRRAAVVAGDARRGDVLRPVNCRSCGNSEWSTDGFGFAAYCALSFARGVGSALLGRRAVSASPEMAKRASSARRIRLTAPSAASRSAVPCRT